MVFDEMNTRKQSFWCQHSQKEIGYVTYGKNSDITENKTENLRVATQAIVYMLVGINKHFKFPICYHFIDSLNATEKKQLTTEVIEKITPCGIEIANLTFDGHKSNLAMCRGLQANLDTDSEDFKPYFNNPVNGKKIHLIFDACHMIKLLRNTLASKQTIFDEHDNEIKWSFFEELERLGKEKKFPYQKLSKKHIQWEASKMNVKIAVETLSSSVADFMEYLLSRKHPQFVNAAPTIRFIRMADKLFDIFNSRNMRNNNLFKRPLNSENIRIVLSFFEECESYFKSLKLRTKTGKSTVKIISSTVKTGFVGFISNMRSLVCMYNDYVVERSLFNSFATYCINQDHLEMFFGKIRSKNGFNDNPNAAQFKGAYKKLLYNTSVMLPQSSNCREFDLDTDISLFTNLYFISSKRQQREITIDEEFRKDLIENEKQIYNDLQKSEDINSNDHLLDDLTGSNIAYMATMIEEKIEKADQFYCQHCKYIFSENPKVNDCYMITKRKERPCITTYNICKTADKFMHLFKQTTAQKNNFNILYYFIFQEIDFSNIFVNSDFSQHLDHKYHIVKCIVNEYIKLKMNQIMRQKTLDNYSQILRKKLTKIIHYSGQ